MVIGVGGLGHLGVQILRALTAAQIIAVDTRPEALQLAERCGADHTVLSGDSAADEIDELTKGARRRRSRGFRRRRFDRVGDDRGATADGRHTGRHRRGQLPFGFFTIPYEASLATTYWGSRPELIEVLELARAGHVKTEVHRFSLDEGPQVYEQLAAGQLTGRAVIAPNDSG